VSNPQKRKGDRAELEVQGWFRDELGIPARRALGAGRKDDVGDIHGVWHTTIQVANYASLDRAVREKLPTLEQQQQNAGTNFAALFVRRRGGKFVVVMTPEMFATLWREAQ
jgi:hypothetical protein